MIYVGTDSGVAAFIGPHTKVLDLPGRMVLPGFHDNHVHPLSAGLELGECNLYDVKTPEEAERVIRDYVAAHPDTGWLRGNGWQLPVFPDANPNKAMLDRIVPDRPAFFWAADGHSAWLNSKALATAGIKRETKDPPGGRIERDADGEPSGTLRESAVDLVTAGASVLHHGTGSRGGKASDCRGQPTRNRGAVRSQCRPGLPARPTPSWTAEVS